MKNVEWLFDSYEYCSCHDGYARFTDRNNNTLVVPVQLLSYMYNFARFESERKIEIKNPPADALALADHLENFRSFPMDIAAAAELRRLYEENRKLRILLGQVEGKNDFRDGDTT